MGLRPDLSARNTKHGLSRTERATYRSWKDLRARCQNPNDSDYKDYGGRGITFDPRWEDFAVFFAEMGRRPEGMSLDRIDVNGNYEAGNCRWATAMTQANNKRSNHRIEWNGRSQTLMEWSRETGVDQSKARYRLKQNWPLEAVFSREDFRV